MKHLQYGLIGTLIGCSSVFIITCIIHFMGIHALLLLAVVALFSLLTLIHWYIDYEVKRRESLIETYIKEDEF